jgi:hypothetical protein
MEGAFMNQTRKMWASAAVVGAIVAGGVWVAAAASAGRLEQVGDETGAVVARIPSGEPEPSGPQPVLPTGQVSGQVPGYDGTNRRLSELTSTSQPQPQPSDDGVVVSKEFDDPGAAVDYWTDKRMEDAQPMPMPEVPGVHEVPEVTAGN